MVLPNLKIHRLSYMSAHVLMNLLNELMKSDKMQGLPGILSFFPNKLINSIIQEHKCSILFIINYENKTALKLQF